MSSGEEAGREQLSLWERADRLRQHIGSAALKGGFYIMSSLVNTHGYTKCPPTAYDLKRDVQAAAEQTLAATTPNYMPPREQLRGMERFTYSVKSLTYNAVLRHGNWVAGLREPVPRDELRTGLQEFAAADLSTEAGRQAFIERAEMGAAEKPDDPEEHEG